MEYKTLTWEVLPNPLRPEEKTIGVITLNRPDFLNAVDVKMRVELDILLDEIRHQSHVRVIVITGAGRGIGEAVASGVGLQHVRDALVAGLNVDTERAQMRQAGWTKGEIKTAEHRANRLASEWGVSPASAMNIIREGRPTFGGDLRQTLASVPDFFGVLTAMRQKNPNGSEGEHNRQLGSLIKAGEIMGYSQDPEKLRQYADFMTKMVQVHGSALRGEEVLNFAKSGKTAASGASCGAA